jgi:hypothetical protein
MYGYREFRSPELKYFRNLMTQPLERRLAMGIRDRYNMDRLTVYRLRQGYSLSMLGSILNTRTGLLIETSSSFEFRLAPFDLVNGEFGISLVSMPPWWSLSDPEMTCPQKGY